VKIATWNVNGIRAREAQLLDFVERERPDVLCLQEIKARLDQVPAMLCEMRGYWCGWHGQGPYSGVAVLVHRDVASQRPPVVHPPFDMECRVATAEVGGVTFASVYVPNGGKDFDAKMKFLDDMDRWAAELGAAGQLLVVCGDLNVARTDKDVHVKAGRKPGAVGQRPDERAALERIISRGLVDVARALHPDDEELFTWWAPWRNMKERNIGWRIDYVLASQPLAARARSFRSLREFGTSDHAPVVVELAPADLAAA
jgi:exodeoxyribonuclease-3